MKLHIRKAQYMWLCLSTMCCCIKVEKADKLIIHQKYFNCWHSTQNITCFFHTYKLILPANYYNQINVLWCKNYDMYKFLTGIQKTAIPPALLNNVHVMFLIKKATWIFENEKKLVSAKSWWCARFDPSSQSRKVQS